VELTQKIQGRAVVAGRAEGDVVFTSEPLSFWGGYNARNGEIIDAHHALRGTNVAGKIFVMPGGRGSSTGSGILLESIRLGTAPAALILSRADQILALGAIVGTELYGKTLPLIVISQNDFETLRKAQRVKVDEMGGVEWL
jgi:predicted aconitase with swiveling domain